VGGTFFVSLDALEDLVLAGRGGGEEVVEKWGRREGRREGGREGGRLGRTLSASMLWRTSFLLAVAAEKRLWKNGGGGREGGREGGTYFISLDALEDLVLAGRGGGEEVVKRAADPVQLADTLAGREGGKRCWYMSWVGEFHLSRPPFLPPSLPPSLPEPGVP